MKTAEQLEIEEAEQTTNMEEDEAGVTFTSVPATKESMDELAAMTAKMTLDKKTKNRRAKKDKDSEMMVDSGEMPNISIKSKAIQKKKD